MFPTLLNFPQKSAPLEDFAGFGVVRVNIIIGSICGDIMWLMSTIA